MTTPDFRQMSPADFAAWRNEQEGQPTPVEHIQHPVTAGDVAHSYAAARELAGMATVAPSTARQKPAVRPAAEVWGKPTTFKFICPSGAECTLKKLEVASLLASGVIDQVSRLPGIAQQVIDKSENLPPKPEVDGIPDEGEILLLMSLLDKIIPMAVDDPTLFPVPPAGEERVIGRIYLDTVSLEDQIAIMNESLKGVVELDAFRADSGESV